MELTNQRLQREIEFWKEQSLNQLRGRQINRNVDLQIMQSEQDALKRQLNESISEAHHLKMRCSELEHSSLENLDKNLVLQHYQ